MAGLQKHDKQLLLKMEGELLDELRQVAQAQLPKTDAQDLLRRAAVAIIECHKLYNFVPADMELRQRIASFELMVAETQAPFGKHPSKRRPRPPPADEKGA